MVDKYGDTRHTTLVTESHSTSIYKAYRDAKENIDYRVLRHTIRRNRLSTLEDYT